MPPEHHKEIALFLREKFEDEASIAAYRDNQGNNPIPIGLFGGDFFSTIGAFDRSLNLPDGNFEFASSGQLDWLPNSIASSIYWLRDRSCDEWPLVCEDVVIQNAQSTYRHMVFIPSPYSHRVSTGQNIQWLLGIPVTDKNIGITFDRAFEQAKAIYPSWLFNQSD